MKSTTHYIVVVIGLHFFMQNINEGMPSIPTCNAGVPVQGEQKAAASEGEGLKNGEGEGEGEGEGKASNGKVCNAGYIHPISVVLRGKH